MKIMSAIQDLPTEEAVQNFLNDAASETRVKVLHFKSEWSNPCKEMTGILQALKDDKENAAVAFAEINAESIPAVSMKYNITAVPTVLVLTARGNEVSRIEGLRKSALMDAIKSNLSKSDNGVGQVEPVTVSKEPKKDISLEDRLKALVNKHDVMVFMKGNPDVPRCGFSRTLIGILKDTGVPFDTFDILEDDEVRQGLKTFSNWQTYPQIYVKGELIGGLDIVKELVEANELHSTLKGES